MTSRRLPGKVLIDVGGRTILEHVVTRLSRARSLDLIIVATSTDASDDAIADTCLRLGVPVHRGPLDDVAARFDGAIDHFHLRAFARVSADSPLLDPGIVDEVAAQLTDGIDVATNVHPRSFPHGQSVEVVRSSTFRIVLPLMRTPEDREHVTSALYRELQPSRIASVTLASDLSAVRMVVDDHQDLARLRRVFALMERAPEDHKFAELVALYVADGAASTL